MPQKRSPTAQQIDSVIRKHLPQLRRPGVLTVRPGYEIADHQLTGKSAIVATVHTKTKDLPRSSMLPDSIANIPVDVREASPHQRLRAHDPAAAALSQAYGRREDRDPTWPYEREMPSGKLLTDPKSDTQRKLVARRTTQPALDLALAAQAKKIPLDYEKGAPSGNFPLTAVETTTTITAHVSPDAGFVTLKKFLAATQQSLIIGMYDFTSGPILEEFLKDLDGAKTLQLVLDHPSLNETANQSDSQTIAKLREQLGFRAQIAWALENHDPMVTAFMFPYAYHIKVIVRDGKAFWLSSGNLNNSNQPDPDSPPSNEDRDWHVIIEDEGLAKTFTAYLDYDYQSAKQHQAQQPDEIAKAVADANTKLLLEANPPPPPITQAMQGLKISPQTPVAAKVFDNVKATITPLLTPDKLPNSTQGQYLANITNLISNAQQKLYIQLQYIEASSGNADNYDNFLKAIAARIAAGVDVKLIVSARYADKNGEKMKAQGVDLTANIYTQPNVHNKGFAVDSRKVVVSSQNFSSAGVETNRDAGVIIEQPDIVEYFESIFLSDFRNQTKPFVASSSKSRTKSPAKNRPGANRAKRKVPSKSTKRSTVRRNKRAAKRKAPSKSAKPSTVRRSKRAAKRKAPSKSTKRSTVRRRKKATTRRGA
jgi:phosphatidylserine/phosphatidylglycerophosphate/cardiolipin synthase-like enzyme